MLQLMLISKIKPESSTEVDLFNISGFLLHVLFPCCFHPENSSHLGYRTKSSIANLECDSKSQCVPVLGHKASGMASSCFMVYKDLLGVYEFQGFVICFFFFGL